MKSTKKNGKKFGWALRTKNDVDPWVYSVNFSFMKTFKHTNTASPM